MDPRLFIHYVIAGPIITSTPITSTTFPLRFLPLEAATIQPRSRADLLLGRSNNAEDGRSSATEDY